MYCRKCGTKNRDDAKFCRGCGVELNKQQVVSKEKRGDRPRRIIPIVAAIAVLVAGACALAFQWAKSRAADAEYEDYLAVQESVQGIEAGYRNQAGYHDPERIPDLLEEVESYGLDNTDLVTSVDRGDDYVEFRLSDGTLYVFMPSLEGLLSGGVDCSIITLEPWWTDVKGIDSLRLDGDDLEIDGFTEVSGFDIWANAVPEAIDEYAFVPNDNVNDSEVTLERLRTIGRNQFVFYFGHGGAPTKSHGSFLTTGEATTRESRERYKDDLKADRLVQTSSGRLAVTDKFFDSDSFGDDAFSNTDFFLLACHSCQDTQLANALIERGARTVTGFTESVTVKYGAEMVYGILGLNDDAKGLTNVGKDGKYLSFAESISNAQSVYGDSDPYLEFKWYEAKHNPASVVCYPTESAKSERLSDTLVAYLDGDKDAAVEFVQTWYSDWTFENGHDVQNAQPLILRCPPLIAEDSELFDEFVESCNSMTGKYSRDFASCVVSTPQVEELDSGVFRVTVRFIGVQNTVDQAMYDRLIANPSEDVWDVTVDKNNKITSLVRVDDYNSSTEDEQAVRTSGKTQDGAYILSGTVRVHKEDFGGQRTDSVVSIVLDEDVPYEYEYKGTVQAEAHDVLLATTGSETFGANRYDEWAQYDGQHITVECDGLQGAYHDASYWKVDTIATGKIRLLSSSSQPISDTSDSEDEYTIHLTGANLVLPEALRGKVDLTVTNNGFEDQVEYAGCGWFLAWNTDTTWVDEWRASGEPRDYADVSSETLPDGTQLIFGYGNDLICQVEIIDPEGNRGILVTSGFEKDFCVYVLGMNEDQVTACRELQDAVTGGLADDSSVDNAFAFLRECAKGLTFTDG